MGTGKKLALVGLAAVGVAGAALVVTSVSATPQGKVTLNQPNPASGNAPLPVFISGSYTDQLGVGISGATLYLFINGAVSGSFSTTSSGAFSTTYTFPSAGTFSVSVSSGTVSSNSVTVTVTGSTPTLGAISINPSATTVVAGGSVTFTGIATDTTGAGLAGVTVSLMINGTQIANVVTGATGNYAMAATFNNAGNFTAQVASGSVGSQVIQITVTTGTPPTVGAISIGQSATTIQAGGSVTFGGLVTDTTGAPLSGVPLSLLVNGAAVMSTTSGAGGAYSMTSQFNTAGTYTVLARYNAAVAVSSPTLTVTVTSLPPPPVLAAISINPSATSITTGGSVTFTGVATDTTGAPMVGVTVGLFIGAAQITSVATGAGGTYSLGATFNTAGTFVATVASGSVSSTPVTIAVAAGTPLISAYVYPSGIAPGFNLNGVPSNPPSPTQSVLAGLYTQYVAFGFVAQGGNPLDIPVDWYNDGVLEYSNVLSSSGGIPNEGVAFFGKNGWTVGTHTIWAVIGGVKTNTITVTAT